MLGALAASRVPHESIDWQPALALREPWRAFSAVFVHYSGLHLGANVAGALLVGALGAAARVPLGAAVAWAAAWPLTQLGLLVQPQLLHYGGLSGVLHAGVAVVALQSMAADAARQRRIGLAIFAVLIAKVLSETPWGPPLRHPPGWDIAITPLAHASGVLAGTLAALSARAARWRRRSAPNIGR